MEGVQVTWLDDGPRAVFMADFGVSFVRVPLGGSFVDGFR